MQNLVTHLKLESMGQHHWILHGGVQTNRINSIFTLIAEIARVFKDTKKGQTINFDRLSSRVTPMVVSSNFFEKDFKSTYEFPEAFEVSSKV